MLHAEICRATHGWYSGELKGVTVHEVTLYFLQHLCN